jgi:hypothetical protein
VGGEEGGQLVCALCVVEGMFGWSVVVGVT